MQSVSYLVPLGLVFFVLFCFVNPAPNQSVEALLNVNKVFMLLTLSEGYTETFSVGIFSYFLVLLLLLTFAN